MIDLNLPKEDIAILVHREFVEQFQRKFKFIDNLRYAELYIDKDLFEIGRTGWYGFIDISISHLLSPQIIGLMYDHFKKADVNVDHIIERCSSCMIGAAVDVEGKMTPERAAEIIQLVKEIDGE